MRWLNGDGGATNICRDYVHRDPIHRRAFRDGVQGMVAKDCGRGKDLTRSDQIEESRWDNRVEGDLLCLELFDQLYASGADNRADDFVTRIADGHSHAAFELRMQQAFVVFRYGVLRKKFLIVSEADVRLAGDGPEIQPSFAFLLGVFRVGSKIR